VVAAKQEDVLGVFDLETNQQEDAFQRHMTTVDVVAQEKIVGVAGISGHLEYVD
jgi:hypothetical protein